MSTKVHLYSNLQSYTDNKSILEIEGSTVGQCLDNLVDRYPALKSRILDKSGHLLSTVFVSLNLNSPNTEPASRPIAAGDEIYLILIVAGG